MLQSAKNMVNLENRCLKFFVICRSGEAGSGSVAKKQRSQGAAAARSSPFVAKPPEDKEEGEIDSGKRWPLFEDHLYLPERKGQPMTANRKKLMRYVDEAMSRYLKPNVNHECTSSFVEAVI
jgi:hypothetical protein